MDKRFMLKIHPLTCADIPLLLHDIEICSNLFFDRLQELKYRHGCRLTFECMQIAGIGYFFDQQGNIMKGTEGCAIRFDYRVKTLTDMNAPLHFILF